MPDIAMCQSTTCPKRRECRRSEDSGTKPDEYRQAYFIWPEGHPEPCDEFWPVSWRPVPALTGDPR